MGETHDSASLEQRPRKPLEPIDCLLIAVSIALVPFICVYVWVIRPVLRKAQRRADLRRSRRLREEWQGAEFFCYSCRYTSRSYLEKLILPELDPKVIVLLYGGWHQRAQVVRGRFDADLIYALLTAGGDDRLPKLLRVSGEIVRSRSLHDLVYRTIDHADSPELIRTAIEEARLVLESRGSA